MTKWLQQGVSVRPLPANEAFLFSLPQSQSTLWESFLILIFLQPQHLAFVFPDNNQADGAGRVQMVFPLIPLSESTALSAEVQNTAAFWE